MALTAMAKKLHAGLGVASNTLDAATVAIDADGDLTGASDGTTTDATFAATDASLPPYGAWKGTDHLVKALGTTDHAVVYSNQDPGEMVPFEDKWGTTAGVGVADILNAAGKVEETNLVAAGRPELVMSNEFESGDGTKYHTEDPNDNVVVYGLFDGAAGRYECDQVEAARCASRAITDLETGKLQGILLSGGWTFEPNEDVMVSVGASDTYVAYGWWSRETADGVDVLVFQQAVGSPTGTQPGVAANSVNSASGTATYSGGAAGKVAIYNPLDSADSDAGAFTAAASLTANFGDGTESGTVNGELTGFMVGSESRNWVVTLGAGPIADEGTINADGTGKTVWSIDGDAADAGGSWSGQFYDAVDQAVNTGDPGAGPSTAAGIFTSVYGDGVGRMTGAFGTTKNE